MQEEAPQGRETLTKRFDRSHRLKEAEKELQRAKLVTSLLKSEMSDISPEMPQFSQTASVR